MKKISRPKVTKGKTERIDTGCGHLYITTGNTVKGNLIEVFAHLGKAGGCINAQNEAITRCISLGLKYGIPKEEFIEELTQIRCPNPSWENGVQITSCASAIAEILKGGNNESIRATAESKTVDKS